jgi:uncharacterized membrane protein YozB (DUF420 family)
MDYIVILASLSLVVQIVTLAIIISSYILKRRMRFIDHGTMMLIAVVVQFLSLLLIMGPAFLSLAEKGFVQRPLWISIITFSHVSFGGVALATGIWITASWHLQTSINDCIKKRRVMRYLIVIWIWALILGITLYTLLYFT